MRFLTAEDYGILIKQEQLEVVLKDNPTALLKAEVFAQGLIESYLRSRYDVAKIFLDVQPWAEARQYAAGAVVSYGTPSVLYVADRATKGEKPGVITEPAAPEVAEPVADLETEPEATEPAPEVEPIEPAWEEKDPRSAVLVTYMLDITLYTVHSRHGRVQMPEKRIDRYDQAIEWLKAVSNGKLSADLPRLPQKEETGRFKWGSQPFQTLGW
ncbi:phage protein Gp36 family protein [Hymenobacter cavernae]|uniref:DUF1320 domain-containing protein n=1 Tax=Hymenobacter cavernae TaxID=2044852 RepID=A0ABQ1UNE8_9BACT|nr:phage protein Gp36 family protein [Hymenobacter cavernae]GGF22346.1 hypothetical protein GCM10011383_37470 [Hymenobacter cavernae]